MAVSSKQLPAKESALFRSIVKCYEIKQYKKGLKAADSILKKYPDHGETLAMKGLTLNCMGRKEEAYEFVKNGLRHDLRSHVCWHVFGLLYRSDRNYNEAIKCYRNAIRIDPENLQILRDLYLLQVQMRDLKGFAETRRTMLTLKPNNRNNWIGFAIAHHLVGNYQMAIDIIEKYFSTLDGEQVPNYEDSEIYLYQNQLLEEAGDLEKALANLEENKAQITDTLAWRQKKGQFLLQLERYEEAREIFEELVEINFDNYEFQRGLQCAIIKRKDLFVSKPTQQKKSPLPSETIDFTKEKNGAELEKALADFYAEKKTTIGAQSLISLRFPLDFTRGEEFKKYADVYLKRQLNKSVPSLGSDLKPLYANSDKAKVLEELILGYLKSLEAKKPLDVGDNSITANSTEQVLLWTNYLAAQHYDRLGNHTKAMEYIE
ncbi:N-terminal acetyltransferase A complex subunit nat1-like protein, partial [Phytophthora palmivora]